MAKKLIPGKEKSKGKKNDAAQILGWGRNTLSKKMKEHGI